MKRLFLVAMMCIVLVSLLAAPAVMAAAAGKSIQGQVTLVQKYSDTDWSIVPGGAWGKFNYALEGTMISGVFNGHGLVAGTDYTLVAYTEDWPNDIVLSTGTVNADGDIHIAVAPKDIGEPYTYPTPDSDEYAGETGYKIWLVPGLFGTLDWPFPPNWLFETSLVVPIP